MARSWEEMEEESAVLPLGCASGSDEEVRPKRCTHPATVGVLIVAGVLAAGLCAVAVSSAEVKPSPAAVTSYRSVVELDKKHASAQTEAEEDEEEEENEVPTPSGNTSGKAKKKSEKIEKKCSWGKENCNATKCCNNPGMQCMAQTEWYAQCRETCTEGAPDPQHWDGIPWTCKKLGDRLPGESKCAELGEDCRQYRCCAQVNTQCFAKNDDWATCKSECLENSPDLADTNGDPWSCEKIGPWTEGAAPWVAEECTADGEDCREKKCCASPGAQCYSQSEFWAQCKYDCSEEPEHDWMPKWSCDEIGQRTPGSGGLTSTAVGKWVPEQCADAGEDCSKSKCCLGTNMQCYAKNKDWAMCLDTCTQGKHLEDNNETWSCRPLGPRLVSGLAIKGSPSLFCWVLFQTTTYENDIMHKQMDAGAGVFQCDEWALLSTDDETVLGKTPEGAEAKTQKVEKAEITTSVDGTAGNAKLFINCWNVIIADGRWRHHAWIIKVDPDAVIIPERVRDHLRSFVLENVYVVNCNKFPSSPNFPMMYGSVEIYSFHAIDTYARNNGLCMTDMGMMLPQWGEDYFMTHCLDHIGVGRISDFVSVGDNVCTGGSCGDMAFSAFHPFKSGDAWQDCWDQAHGAPAPPPQWG